MSPAIVASDLAYAWPEGDILFDGLDLTIGPGRTGLVGANGSGKSTLLRLLAGVDRPDRGAVATGAGERIGWLAQEAPAVATLNGCQPRVSAGSAMLGNAAGSVWPGVGVGSLDSARSEASSEPGSARGGWTGAS